MTRREYRSLSCARAFAVAGLLAVSSCVNDNALINVRNSAAGALPSESITVVLTAPGYHRILTPDELGGADIPTPTSGSITISYELQSGTVSASTGALALSVARDRVLGVTISLDSIDPMAGCFGCVGSRSFPLASAFRRAPKDSIWIVWGSNSISKPVVF